MADQWGIWSAVSKRWCFGISEPTQKRAWNKLREKIGKNARKWRFEAWRIASDGNRLSNDGITKITRKGIRISKNGKILNPKPKRRMNSMAIDNTATKVITGKVRLSYCHIFEPQSIDGGDEKYSTAILIPKSDKETLRKIKSAVDSAKELGKSKWGGKIPANCKTPLRDGDEERPDEEAYAGHYFLNATSKTKPGIAKPIGKTPDGKTKFQEITDSTEVYSGCYAKLSLNFYPFDAKGNRGVAAGLNNVVKVQDGDYLGGRASVRDEFADEDFEDVVDISDDEEDFLN